MAIPREAGGLPVRFQDDVVQLYRMDGSSCAGLPGFDPDADGDGDIRFFPHFITPPGLVRDPRRSIEVARRQTIRDVLRALGLFGVGGECA